MHARRRKVRRMATRQELARIVKGLRQERGWTQTELGQRLGVSGATVSRWESGEHIMSEEHMREIARLRGMDAGRFVERVQEALESSKVRQRLRGAEVEGSLEEAREMGDHRVLLLDDGSLLVNDNVRIYSE